MFHSKSPWRFLERAVIVDGAAGSALRIASARAKRLSMSEPGSRHELLPLALRRSFFPYGRLFCNKAQNFPVTDHSQRRMADVDSRFGGGIARCEQIILYTFTNKLLLAEALNCAGPLSSVYVADGLLATLPKNDRLAVYGDTVVAAALCRDWYYGSSVKAIWTSNRTETLCNEFFAKTGFSLGLDTCLSLNAGTLSVGKNIMATAVEAILGATHLDGGDSALRHVLTRLGLLSQSDT